MRNLSVKRDADVEAKVRYLLHILYLYFIFYFTTEAIFSQAAQAAHVYNFIISLELANHVPL